MRLVGAYLAVLWLLGQGIVSLGPPLGVPDWVLRAFLIVGVMVIPLLAFLSWKYDIVPPQLVRDARDVAASNPGLAWARVRHDVSDAGYVLLKWETNGSTHEKRSFQPVAIGREANNDIELSDTRVSRHHAVLWAESGGWHVRDLDSTNGTFIGHARIDGTAPLPQTCALNFVAAGLVVHVFVATSEKTQIG